MSDVTERQLAAIYNTAKYRTMDAQAESLKLFGLEPEALTVRQASDLIDWMKADAIERRALKGVA